jgi:hypothetical protein
MIPDQTRRVLLGLSGLPPETGHNLLTGIDMRKGWGDTIFVTCTSPGLAPPVRPTNRIPRGGAVDS